MTVGTIETVAPRPVGIGKPMGVNWVGLWTIIRREVSRVMRVPVQAFVAPWISALLFIFIFGFVVGGRINQIGGHRYLEFVLPGIVMMNVVNAAFLQSSSAIYFSRFIRFIEEILVAPLSYAEMIAGTLSVVVLRASVTGIGILLMGVCFGAAHVVSWPLFLFWIVSVSAVAPLMLLHVLPPFADVCHCTVGAGRPEAEASKIALWPSSTVVLAGCLVTVGGVLTVSVAALLVASPAMFVNLARNA